MEPQDEEMADAYAEERAIAQMSPEEFTAFCEAESARRAFEEAFYERAEADPMAVARMVGYVLADMAQEKQDEVFAAIREGINEAREEQIHQIDHDMWLNAL